jgi:hypothetical protein
LASSFTREITSKNSVNLYILLAELPTGAAPMEASSFKDNVVAQAPKSVMASLPETADLL